MEHFASFVRYLFDRILLRKPSPPFLGASLVDIVPRGWALGLVGCFSVMTAFAAPECPPAAVCKLIVGASSMAWDVADRIDPVELQALQPHELRARAEELYRLLPHGGVLKLSLFASDVDRTESLQVARVYEDDGLRMWAQQYQAYVPKPMAQAIIVGGLKVMRILKSTGLVTPVLTIGDFGGHELLDVAIQKPTVGADPGVTFFLRTIQFPIQKEDLSKAWKRLVDAGGADLPNVTVYLRDAIGALYGDQPLFPIAYRFDAKFKEGQLVMPDLPSVLDGRGGVCSQHRNLYLGCSVLP